MNKFILTFCLTLFVATFCYDDLKYEELPLKISDDIKLILKDRYSLKGDCQPLKAVDVKFLMFNRKSPNDGILINPTDPQGIDPQKKIVVIIHGWLGNSKSKNIQSLKDAYLQRYDGNIILVDWNATAFQPYLTSTCEMYLGAQTTSNFLCLLNRKLQVSLGDMHVIGHGLGGHMAGVVGYNLINRCKQTLGRITGLDPTYPLFFRVPEKDRLDEKDALFVDIIHTDYLYFGYSERCGAVDFNPNCALQQPGCPRKTMKNDTLIADDMCSHLRSIDLMTESVNSKDLLAVSCGLCPRYCKPDIVTEVYQVMGEDCRKVPKPAKNFLIPTNGTPPYGLGKGPYRNLFMLNYKEANKILMNAISP